MGNLSLVFHIVSLFCFVGLILWGLRFQNDLRMAQGWLRPSSRQRFLVGEPVQILKQFARVIGAEFEQNDGVVQGLPRKMQPYFLFCFHRQWGIRGIRVSKKDSLEVFLDLEREPDTMNEDYVNFVGSLGEGVEVRWR